MNELPIILASSSVYRHQLLAKLRLPFTCVSPDIDETPHLDETPEDLVLRLSDTKAKKVAEQHKHHLIIGSDQVAVFNNRIIGKPQSHSAAMDQLTCFAGQTVSFLTGLCLLNSQTNTQQLSLETCHVRFRKLTQMQIEAYLLAEKPYDCAGSFKSEGLGIALFESIDTKDPNTLIGLPLIKLTSMLIKEGRDPLAGIAQQN